MASECIAYRDSKGILHTSAERATLEDLASVLGRVGEEGGMTAGVARMIFDKRYEIERVFAEHDALLANSSSQTIGRNNNAHVLHAIRRGDSVYR